MKIMTVKEASEHYQKSVDTIYYWRNTGLNPIKGSDPISFLKEDLDKFVKKLAGAGRKMKKVPTEKLIKRYIAGESARSIAKDYPLTHQAILNRIRKAGVKIR